MDLHLDLSAPSGRRAVIERALRDAIRSGRLAAGARLPSTRALAAELGTSRGTVTAAYDQLTAEGYLVARHGSGTTVADLTDLSAPAPPMPAQKAAPRYDLRPGAPDVTAFPVAAWLRSARRAMSNAPASAFGYGDPAGQLPLRTALAEYLGRARGVLARPEQIVITTGYVQALALLAQVLGRDDAIAMEDPGLPFHRDVVHHSGARVVPLPVDGDGARTDLLPETDVAACVLTPAHQYPLGLTLHPQRRHDAAEWARQRPGLIVEDDYDGEFRYDRQPVGAMQGIAPDHVVYVGTASKTLGPALRLAWVVLPERLVEPFIDAKRHADLHSDIVSQLTLADLIRTHAYDRHIRACRLRYRSRRDALVRRLATVPGVTVEGVAAGLHAVIRLAEPAGVDLARTEAARHDLALDDVDRHWHGSPRRRPGLIVGYGRPPDGRYPAALDVLVRVLRSVSGQNQVTSGKP
ncbi:MAG TPA: PLP-dependent aminotransferase family protein [Jiangellaceae bacterium]